MLHELPDLTSAPSRRNSQYVRMQRHAEGQTQGGVGGTDNNTAEPFIPPTFTPFAPYPNAYGQTYGAPYTLPYGAPYPPILDIRRNPSANGNSNPTDGTTLGLSRSSSLDHNAPGFPNPHTNASASAGAYPNVMPYASVPPSQSQTPYHSQPGSAAASVYNDNFDPSFNGDSKRFFDFEFEGGARNPNAYPGSTYTGSVKYPPSHAYSHAQSYSVDANAQAQALAAQRAQRVARRQSTSSRVSYDYFDPQGMTELVRKLSRMEKSTSSTAGVSGRRGSGIVDDQAAVVDIAAVRRSPSMDSASVSEGSDKAGMLGGSPGNEKDAMVLGGAAGAHVATAPADRKGSFDLESTLRAAIEQ